MVSGVPAQKRCDSIASGWRNGTAHILGKSRSRCLRCHGGPDAGSNGSSGHLPLAIRSCLPRSRSPGMPPPRIVVDFLSII